MRPLAPRVLFLLLAAALAAPASDLPYPDGERLTYHFYWGFFMVGRGTFEVRREKGGMEELTVRVRSNDFISAIYPVEDLLRSRFDPRRLRAELFEQDRHEGTHRVWEHLWFLYDRGHAWMKSWFSDEEKWFEIPPEGVVDKLSLVYFMRHKDWRARDRYRAVVGNDKENQNIEVRKLGKESVKLDDFPPMIPAFRVETDPQYLKGFVKGGRMEAWVSDDARKIPLKVVARLSVGTVSARLVAVEGVENWPAPPPEPE